MSPACGQSSPDLKNPREVTLERHAKEARAFPSRSRVLSRLALLARNGELARRLTYPTISVLLDSSCTSTKTREGEGFCSHTRTVISAQYIQVFMLYHRVGLLFTHMKNGDFSAISVTGRSCAAPISKLESHISNRCSYYTTA